MLDWIAGRATRFTVVCVIPIRGGVASRVHAAEHFSVA
jgi:hypothetical protein